MKKLGKNNTPTLVRTMLVRADSLLRVTFSDHASLVDKYQALGMALDLLQDADRLFCLYYHNEIPDGVSQKSFEELLEGMQKPKAVAARGAK